jgi:hypothetical protein
MEQELRGLYLKEVLKVRTGGRDVTPGCIRPAGEQPWFSQQEPYEHFGDPAGPQLRKRNKSCPGLM